jgi:hypothetical protein
MRRPAASAILAAALMTATAYGAESKWTVMHGSTQVATVTLLTSGQSARAEWKKGAASAPVIFIRAGARTWVRATGGDIEVGSYKGGEEKTILPALLVVDANRTTVKVASGSTSYTLSRTSFSPHSPDASTFTVRPRQGAATRLARLSGDLLGPTSSGASATAGGRGASGKGLKLDDVGNYDALAKVESRDDAWRKNLDAALDEFQKDGKVGKERP